MDLQWGFNNLHIQEGDKATATSITHMGLFEHLVMQFRMCNTPSSFQAMMNEVLKEEVAMGKVIIYIDDILIFTEKVDELQQMMKQVLQWLQENNLYFSASQRSACLNKRKSSSSA
jgi:hypothetical protein